MTVAARAMEEKKAFGHRSYLVATRRQSLSLANMVVSQKCRQFDGGAISGPPLCQGSCPLLYFFCISQVGGIGR